METRLLLFVLFVLPGFLNAQHIELLKDINRDQTGIQIYQSVAANNMLFMAVNEGNRSHLLRIDGITDGTIQLTGEEASGPEQLVNAGSYLVFVRYYNNDTWLYRSDGTREGTFVIHKTATYSRIPAIANVNGTIYFSVEIPHGEEIAGYQLWKTDGTAAKTMLVKDFSISGAGGPEIGRLSDFNGKLSFVVQSSPTMLWLSDGTEAGTQPADTLQHFNIQPVVMENNMYFSQEKSLYKFDGKKITKVKGGFEFIWKGLVIGKTLYFAARHAQYGDEIWKTDGTTEGTVLVKDIYPGKSISSDPIELTDVNGILFFKALTADGYRLWKSDGTPEGTVQACSIELSDGRYIATALTAVGNQIAFIGRSGKLYKSDGTEEGTQQLTTFKAGNIHGRVGNEIYFSALEGNGNQLYKSDLTIAGTKAVTNKPITSGSKPYQLSDVNGTAFFIASPKPDRYDLWKSDGTPNGTVRLKGTNTTESNYLPGLLTNVNGTLFYVVNEDELWKSDGTSDGTVQVYKANDPYHSSNRINQFIQTDKSLMYTQGFFRDQLWRTDGTTEGTYRLNDKGPDYFSGISGMTNVDGTVFFGSQSRKYNDLTGESESYTDLWKTNGETQGTVLLRTFNDHITFNPVAFKGELYFGAWDEANSVELWKSDGTTNGTKVVSHVTDSLGTILEQSGTIIALGNYLYYITNAADGYPLVRTDGTEAGTKVIKNLFPGGHLKDFKLYTASGLVFLTVHNLDTNQQLLWRIDGTAEGTYQLGTFDAYQPGDFIRDGSEIHMKGEVNGKLLFVPFSRQFGDQLWATDGTTEGTRMLTPAVSTPFDFTLAPAVRYGNLFYFAMYDQQAGTELWQSDGTPEGTHLAAELNPEGSSIITELAVIGGNLFMAASNGSTGVELYKYIKSPEEDQIINSIADAYVRNVPFEKTNFGTSQELGVKAGSREGYQRKTYLQFPLTGTANVTSAKLRVYGYNYQNEQQVTLAVTGIENDNWTETGIIWPNAPSLTGDMLDSVHVNHQPRYYEMDVTRFVQAQLAGDKTATFVLTNPTEMNIRLFLSSRESKVNPPELIISTQGSTDARMAAWIGPEKKTKDASVLYPNPIQDRFSVQLSDQHKGTSQFTLIYPNGKIQKLNMASSTSWMHIDVSSLKLPAGKYLLQVKSDSKHETFHIIVSNEY